MTAARLTRRSAALALAALAAGGRPARAATDPLALRVSCGPNDTVSEIFYAIKLGYFQKRNLTVQLQLMASGAAQSAALAGGAVDVAESNVVSIANAHLRGLPFVYIAPAARYATEAPTTVLLTQKSAPYKTGKDLNGKTIAIVALKDLTNLGPALWVERTGGDVSSVKFVEMPATEMGPALQRGTVAAAMAPEPALHAALVENDTRVLANALDAIGPAFQLNGWITTQDFLKKNPDAIARFADAIIEGGHWGNANRKASAEIFKQYSKTPPEAIDAMARAVFAEKLDPALFQPVIDAAAHAKFIERGFPALEIVASPH